jgi:hypothetical protein
MPNEHVDQHPLSPPVVGEAAQMRDHERHPRVLGRDQLDGGRLPHHVVQHGQPERLRHLAHLPGYPGVVPVHLDTAGTPAGHRLGDNVADPAQVPGGIHHGVPGEARGLAGHDAANLRIRGPVVRSEGGEQNRPANPGAPGPAQVRAERGVGVPRAG